MCFVVRGPQVASCPQHFQGWLLWTWDTDRPNEQPELWSMVDDNGAINGVLSPIVRKDPFRPIHIPGANQRGYP